MKRLIVIFTLLSLHIISAENSETLKDIKNIVFLNANANANTSPFFLQQIETKYLCPTTPLQLSATFQAFSTTGSVVVNENTIKLSNQIGKQILNLTNQHRAANGRPPLSWDPLLAKVVRGHTIKMADGRRAFDHTGFENRINRYKRLLAEKNPNLTVFGAGENIFYGSNIPTNQVASVAVNAWKNSPGHNANLLGNFNRMGAAAFKNSANVWYVSQIFALVR